jgi:LuxR family transcriptional regulator, maltose regulon positive regulatory protein
MVQQAFIWHQQRNEESRAIPYLFLLRDESRLVEALFTYIPAYLEQGQVSTVQGWLERISPRAIAANAGLLVAKAEVARHTNQFAAATQYYDAAHSAATEQGDRAMLAQVELGRARLFLDTIQPHPAAQHIRAARQWVERTNRQTRCSILQLAFENSINRGRIQRAKRLQRALATLAGARLPDNNSDARLLLRCGKIHEVISVLKPRVSEDLVDGRNALSHREGALLLSLMYAMCGEVNKAREQALRGHRVGHSLSAPFVSAVGHIRLGHAQHLMDPLSEDALSSYQEAIGSMDEMEVPRGKSEALLGLCLAHGYRRQFGLARSYAQQGTEIASKAGDIWMASLVQAGFGQIAVVNEAYDTAIDVLSHSVQQFARIGDRFLETASRLWRAFAWFYLNDGRWQEDLEEVLLAVELNGWEFLLQRPTLCGVRDLQAIVPLLQAYRREGAGRRLALRHLHELQGDVVEHHPGYTLRVQTLGRFSVRRGFTEVTRRDWQREKARQLFQFFLTHRNTLMHREEICERLWGDIDLEAAERDFKVALNGLSNAIEPTKPGRGPSAFIVRQGSHYGLTHHPMLVIDRDEFSRLVREAETETDDARCLALLSDALQLYCGDYLLDVRYETWCDTERDKLRLVFIQAAVRFAELCWHAQRYSDTLDACEGVVEIEPTWEDAYVWLMKTYGAQYNRPMVVQTYRTCIRVLERELGVAPMESTTDVYHEIMGMTSDSI